MAKRNSICVKSAEYPAVKFSFANGKEYDVNVKDLSEAMQQQAMVHGISQKLGDAYAKSESADEAEEKFLLALSAIEAGEWNSKRSGTGGLVVEALARAQGMELSEAKEVWERLDEEGQKKLRKHPAIKKAIAEIQLERAKDAPELDLSAL